MKPLSTAQWAVVSAHWPGRTPQPIGILLSDGPCLHVMFRQDWYSIAPESEVELWRELALDLESKGREYGGRWVLDWLEDTASHTIRVTNRSTILVRDVQVTLTALFEEHVTSWQRKNTRKAQWRYSLCAAAATFVIALATVAGHRFYISNPARSYCDTSAYKQEQAPTLSSHLPLQDLAIGNALLEHEPSVSRRHLRGTAVNHLKRRYPFAGLILYRRTAQTNTMPSPPSCEIAEIDPNALAFVRLPRPQPPRAHRNRFRNLMSRVGYPFKWLLLLHNQKA